MGVKPKIVCIIRTRRAETFSLDQSEFPVLSSRLLSRARQRSSHLLDAGSSACFLHLYDIHSMTGYPHRAPQLPIPVLNSVISHFLATNLKQQGPADQLRTRNIHRTYSIIFLTILVLPIIIYHYNKPLFIHHLILLTTSLLYYLF